MKKFKVTEEELAEKRSAINAFVKSKGAEKRDGFTSVEGGALIPQELLQPQIEPEDIVDLSKYVRSVPVNSASGKFPVISKSGSKMATVQELEKIQNLQTQKWLKLITLLPLVVDIFNFARND